ncbi:hypothetical protein BS50DRAFT_590198 [Corynespora cassiicola Philippines]|uniref:Amidase domain-containing protein n=1 Tax=Corynespora cassiicola Philippines TaxID=1448308 RepID=A0A2T2NG14_CORCC|nr:hypothetical protein BS50DRAFT_590198 [Corynespora cassiicola Philippines]
MREEPLECVESTAPFNPRADGYQGPSESGHASAASISSYDWLDFSLGSDTNGSGRKPASYNGCFSIRPSTGILSTKRVVGYFPQFDMPVFFGRDISRFSKSIPAWYRDSPMLRVPSQSPVKILYPSNYLPTTNEAQTRLIDAFVSGLEAALQIERTAISLAELWAKDCPDGPVHGDISVYLDTGTTLAMLLDKVLKADSKGCTTIMILPIEADQPNYREAEPPSYGLLSGYASLNMSPMTRSPEVTAPVSDIPYISRVTHREERLPIAVSVIGAPGMATPAYCTDLILTDLVEKGLKAGGIETRVKTGRSMY